MQLQLHGLHHVTAISADARANHAFYTGVLGMRLVKKTVNQDDTSAYHLFYADGEGSPGTDLTFFEWPVARERRGTRAVTRTGLRIHGAAAFVYWAERLKAFGVPFAPTAEIDGRLTIEFEDPESQRLSLVDDGGIGVSYANPRADIPAAFQIRGLGPIRMSVPDLRPTATFISTVYGMREVRSYAHPESGGEPIHVFEMGDGGAGAELHVVVESALPAARQGAGAVHHVAFLCRDDEYAAWVERYNGMGLPSSGPVDRFYFRSLYIREPGGILFEIATDGPGFDADEPKASMGDALSLPPFLEHRRAEIEAGLKPI